MAQLGRRYGLPVGLNVGLTDSLLPDGQSGLEKGVTLAMGALAGADIFGHLGICGADQGASLAMLVMQHELIGYVDYGTAYTLPDTQPFTLTAGTFFTLA